MFERAEPTDSRWYANIGCHLARYRFAIDYVQDKSILDAGTGPGYGAYLLKTAGAKAVQAIDIDQKTIENARRNYSVEGLQFIVDNCETLDETAKPIEVICNFENIEHLQRPHEFLKAAAAALVNDGLLLCSTPDRLATPPHQNGKPANPYHVNEWYRNEFEDLLRNYFEDVEIRAQVETFAQNARRTAIVALCQEFHYNPVLRVTRLIARAFGGNTSQANLEKAQGLAAGSDQDYPILEHRIAPIFGVPFCHVAICRKPNRRLAQI